MSFLRIVRPGEPVRPELFIDLGIARGRVSPAHAGSLGGPLEYGRPISKPSVETMRLNRLIDSQWVGHMITRPEQPAHRPSVKDPCGRLMRTGGACGRSRNHDGYCKSRAAMTRSAANRRAMRAAP